MYGTAANAKYGICRCADIPSQSSGARSMRSSSVPPPRSASANVPMMNAAKTNPAGRVTSGGDSSTMKRGGAVAWAAAAPRPSEPGSTRDAANAVLAVIANAAQFRRVRSASRVKMPTSARPSA